jgi:hypothetical protein
MTDHAGTTRNGNLVKVARAGDEGEAELLQGLLRAADVGSVLRRAPGFDVPEFGAAGPRDVLVAASDVPVAQDALRQVDPGEPATASPSGAGRRRRVLALVLIPLAVVVLVVCLATDVIV